MANAIALGPDMPITVYSDAKTGGTRAMVKKIVLGGVEYAGTVKAMANVKRAGELVSIDKSGIAAVGHGFALPGQVKILATRKLERPLGFVTFGEPQPAVRAVIDAFAREARTP